MTRLLPLYGICFTFAYICNITSEYDYYNERYVNKSRVWYLMLSVFTVLFAGLRTQYNDTSTYIAIYENINVENGIFNGLVWEIGEHPSFYLVCRIMKAVGFSSQSFIMLFSLFSIGVQLWFVRKYANNTGLAVFLFFTIGCFNFSIAAIKQCVATAICLIAVDMLIRGKRFLFVLLVLISTTFHPFSIVFILCPILRFRPWSHKTFIMLVIGIIAGVTLQIWLGRALDLFSLMGIEYEEGKFISEGVNVFRVAALGAPVMLSFFLSGYLNGLQEDRTRNLMINLMTLNALIMFVAMFGNPVYIGRLANYFLIFQIIGITYLLQCFKKESRGFMIMILVILYSIYAYYGNAVLSVFDNYYRSVSLMDYLRNIFN